MRTTILIVVRALAKCAKSVTYREFRARQR
jgi:hypothetical protein